MKKSSDTLRNRTHDILVCSAVPQPLRQRVPPSHTIRTGQFPGTKRPGRGVDHLPPSSAEVKERVGLYLYSHFGPSAACSRVNFTLFSTHHNNLAHSLTSVHYLLL
jgi:hypothetical protein